MHILMPEIPVTIRMSQGVDPVEPDGPWALTSGDHVAVVGAPAAAEVSAYATYSPGGPIVTEVRGTSVTPPSGWNWAFNFGTLPPNTAVRVDVTAILDNDSGVAKADTKTAA